MSDMLKALSMGIKKTVNTCRVCWIWESESTQYLISGDVEFDDDGLHNNKTQCDVCRIAVGCSERVQRIMSAKCSFSRCFRVCILERDSRDCVAKSRCILKCTAVNYWFSIQFSSSCRVDGRWVDDMTSILGVEKWYFFFISWILSDNL